MASNRHSSTPYSVSPKESYPREVTYRDTSSYDEVEPPKKIKKRRNRDNTEFHDTLFSFGSKDYTKGISNAEFTRQVAAEIGYFGKLGGSYISDAFGALCDIVNVFVK